MADLESRLDDLQSQVDDLAARLGVVEEEVEEGSAEFQLQEYIGNTLIDKEVPETGTKVIHKSYLWDPGYTTLAQYRLTAVSGGGTFSVFASEPTGTSQPLIDGVSDGDVLQPGSHRIIRLRSRLTGGRRVFPHYKIEVDGEPVIDVTVRYSSQLMQT